MVPNARKPPPTSPHVRLGIWWERLGAFGAMITPSPGGVLAKMETAFGLRGCRVVLGVLGSF